MMREIEFRAWDKKEKVMCWVSIIDFEHRECVLVYPTKEYKEKTKSFDEIELIQYTGLKDKNNKEIYEGDIIKNIQPILSDSKKIGVINYVDGAFRVEWLESGEDLIYYYDTERFFEIIGNIYENSELLRKVKQG